MRAGDDGQASIEHLGLVLLVVLLLLGATAIAEAAGAGLSNRVTTAMQRALCTVGMQDCPTLRREPCPMGRSERTRGLRVAVGWIRLGDDRALQVERRSDDTYAVTLIEGVRGGVGAMASIGALTAEAAILRGADAGRTYEVRGRAAADALVRRLRSERLPAASTLLAGAADLTGLRRADPSVSSYTLAGTAIAEAGIASGYRDLLEGGLDGTARNQIGLRISTREPRATAYLQLDGRVNAFFDLLPKVIVSAAGHGRAPRCTPRRRVVGAPARSRLAGPHRDGLRHHRTRAGPRAASARRHRHRARRSGSHQQEIHARLDPREPAVAAALASWRRAPLSGDALAELGRAASTSAAVDVRDYAVGEDSSEIGGQVGVGPGIGITLGKGLTTTRLTDQRSRPVGGVWERRLDCGLGP